MLTATEPTKTTREPTCIELTKKDLDKVVAGMRARVLEAA